MDKRLSLFSVIFTMMFLIIPASTFAQSEKKELKDRELAFEFLEDAYEAQVSLSEKTRTMDEIENILNPYFTEEYKAAFIKENVVGQENEFQTYGTDFAPYYIPFYAFSDKTKVVRAGNEMYVIEHFPAEGDGPVSYESHYEALKIVKEKGDWKVAEYLYDDIPEKVIEKAYPEKNKGNEKSAMHTEGEGDYFSQNLVTRPNSSVFKTFMELGVIFGSETKTLLFGIL